MSKFNERLLSIGIILGLVGILFLNYRESKYTLRNIENRVTNQVNNIRLEMNNHGKEIYSIQKIILKTDSTINKEIAFRYAEEIVNTANRYESLTSSLLTALLYQESKFDAKAVSRAGAEGLGQIMPETAIWICKEWNIPHHKKIAFEPITNIRMSAWYLDWVYHNSKVVNNDIELMLAYYNGGGRQAFRYNVYRQELEGIKIGKLGKLISQKLSLETKGYVENIIKREEMYSDIIANSWKS